MHSRIFDGLDSVAKVTNVAAANAGIEGSDVLTPVDEKRSSSVHEEEYGKA